VKLSLVVALAALVVGCSSHAVPPGHKGPWGGPCDRAYFVTPEFSTEERASLESSVTRWNERAITKLCLFDRVSSDHDDRHIVYKGRVGEWTGVEVEPGKTAIGLYRSWPDTIGILEGLSLDDFELVALHEFGHSHDLAHTARPALMAPSIGSATDFTEIDMTECRRVGACAGASVLTLTAEPAGCVLLRHD
jgi:hypothetical protein